MFGLTLVLALFISPHIDGYPKLDDMQSPSEFDQYGQVEDDTLYVDDILDDDYLDQVTPHLQLDNIRSQTSRYPSIFDLARSGRHRRRGGNNMDNNRNDYKKQSKKYQSQNGVKLSRSKKKSKEIYWQSCSPKNPTIDVNVDSFIYCKAIVPIGTTFTWYTPSHKKDVSPLAYANQKIETNIIPSTNMMLVTTRQFIFCPKHKDRGLYEVQATTPSGEVDSRYFKIEIIGRSMEEAMCNTTIHDMCKIHLQEYVIGASAKENSTITFQCRYTGYMCDYKGMLFWNFERRIDDSGRIYANDDGTLVIKNLRKEDSGVYMCVVQSSYYMCQDYWISHKFHLNVTRHIQ